MLIEAMDDDTAYEMLVGDEVRMLSLGSFFKAMIANPKVIESCEGTNIDIPDVEYRVV